ncbi:MAG: tagatose 1,6-diphosphate aldolase [Acidobacteriota bacterium]|nr:tagatose 1,6-diphosphate aldolase [Acidobacteriota bacterium]
MSLSPGKTQHMNALSNSAGIIAAAAMDQRGSLKKGIASAKGVAENQVTDHEMEEFKVAVSRILTPHASAILLDPEWGLPAAKARAANAGLLLAYEETGYDATDQHRMPDLLPRLSVKRIVEMGANAVKILLYYTPFSPSEVNDIKQSFIERIGAECEAYDIPFFLEFVGYDENGKGEKSLEYAKKKPSVVKGAMLEFSKPQYKVDVLKVEVPINPAYVEGSRAYKGEKAYSRAEALEHFRDAASVATRPFIYLSAGVSNPIFIENLEFAAESGTKYSGVLCGRATWLDGVKIYGEKGIKALEDWLSVEGVKNIEAVNQGIKGATSWREMV